MLAQVVLKLIGPLDQLRLVWQTGETLLDSVEFDEDQEGTRYNVLLALQEMVTNILRHAYKLKETEPIEVVFSIHNDYFEVLLRDRGPAFDPLTYDTAEVAFGHAMPDEAGGFGIHIARMVMDEVTYRRSDGHNELRMRKVLHAFTGAR
jgi:serine/threonine-protein kinase RsbW